MSDLYPFIAIDGLDGAGKTTLRKGLFRLFQDAYGIKPLSILTSTFLDPSSAEDIIAGKYGLDTFEPTRHLRALIRDKEVTTTALIRPSLQFRPVIADRWVLSDLVYLATKYDLGFEGSIELYERSHIARPDLSILLDLRPENSPGRAASRPGDSVRPDWDNLEVQSRVSDYYAELLAGNTSQGFGVVRRVDAHGSRAEILHRVWNLLGRVSN